MRLLENCLLVIVINELNFLGPSWLKRIGTSKVAKRHFRHPIPLSIVRQKELSLEPTAGGSIFISSLHHCNQKYALNVLVYEKSCFFANSTPPPPSPRLQKEKKAHLKSREPQAHSSNISSFASIYFFKINSVEATIIQW